MTPGTMVRIRLLECAQIHSAIGRDEGRAQSPITGARVPNAANCPGKPNSWAKSPVTQRWRYLTQGRSG
jgi:hypothetical protein